MKFKKLMTTTLFLLIILSISAVNAASIENTMTSDLNDNSMINTNNEEEPTSPNTVLSENNKEPVKTGTKSFNELNTEINNKINSKVYELTLNDDYSYASGDDVDGIRIDGNSFSDGEPKIFTIKGNGKTIDAKKQSRAFIVLNGAHLIIENLKLNGYSSNSGGIITVGEYNSPAQLTLINSVLNNNEAYNGGAISIGSSFSTSPCQLTIINSTLNDNFAYNSGGAIETSFTTSIINNSIFNNNKAGNNGGAINIDNSNSTIIHTKFTNNKAGNNGGAIQVIDYQYRSQLLMKNSELTNNMADNNGGAIVVCYSNLDIADTKINNNYADNNGGAISGSHANLKVTLTEISNNKASKNGNGIYLELQSNAKINNCNLTNNNIYQYDSNIDLTGSKITNTSSRGRISQPKTIRITASKKTFKRKVKTKKYIVIVKTGKTFIKNLKLTLRINGKTYTAKTNNKGKATFKITKLTKKGKYKAKIIFKGNKNYKKATKTVKITIK